MASPKARDREGYALSHNESMANVDAGRVKIRNYTASSTLSHASFYLLHCLFNYLRLSNVCICLLVMLCFHFHSVPNTFSFLL